MEGATPYRGALGTAPKTAMRSFTVCLARFADCHDSGTDPKRANNCINLGPDLRHRHTSELLDSLLQLSTARISLYPSGDPVEDFTLPILAEPDRTHRRR